MTIGLADWHVYELGKGYKTALQQTQTNLFLILVRPDSVEYRRYADIHGMDLDMSGHTTSLEDAIAVVSRLL